jgi:hypothetical protein
MCCCCDVSVTMMGELTVNCCESVSSGDRKSQRRARRDPMHEIVSYSSGMTMTEIDCFIV